MPLPFTRREPAVEDGPLLDDLLAFYEVTTPVADRTRPTGLPAPTRRRRGAPAPAAPPTPQASPDELAEAIGEPDLSSAVLEPAVAATAADTIVTLVPGEPVGLEVIDIDGTAYLFRGKVAYVDTDEVHLAVPAPSPDALLGREALQLSSGVVAVVQRDDESWLLTTHVLSTCWAEAAMVVVLRAPRRAASVARRVHERAAVQVPVALPATVGAARCTTVDLSLGGAALAVTGAQLVPTGAFDVVLLLPDPVSVRAVVLGTHADDDERQTWHVQFVVVPPDAMQRLSAVVARRA